MTTEEIIESLNDMRFRVSIDGCPVDFGPVGGALAGVDGGLPLLVYTAVGDFRLTVKFGLVAMPSPVPNAPKRSAVTIEVAHKDAINVDEKA